MPAESDKQQLLGGQAVIEGVMMRAQDGLGVAVRRTDGAIVVRRGRWRLLGAESRLWRRPFLRGGLVLAETLANGIGALNFSAAVALEGEQRSPENAGTPAATGSAGERTLPPGGASVGLTVALAVALAVGLFVALPHMAVWLGGRLSGHRLDVDDLLFHLITGGVKLVVFIGYLALISLMKDVRRLFIYHGAEHQTIHAWERGLGLEVEPALEQTPLHPRCGTTFLIMVVAVSILVFALVFPPLIWLLGRPTGIGWLDQVIYVLIKLPLLVPIAGLAYELQRFTARHQERAWARVLALPGLLVQRLTTRRAGRDEIEVALVALQAAQAARGHRGEPLTEHYADYRQARQALASAAGGEVAGVCQAG